MRPRDFFYDETPMYYTRPKYLAKFLRASLENGNYRLTFKEIAQGHLSAKKMTKAEIAEGVDEIKRCWHGAERHLRSHWEICAILCTKFYFDGYDKLEPTRPNELALCIAGGGINQGAFGVRLLTMKGTKNDPMAIAYLRLRTRNMRGMMSAIEDRATIEWKRGKLSKPIARRLVDNAVSPMLPFHEAEFN